MNLNKLFNYKFLLENIKKSKMTIILFLIIVPVFTNLVLIANRDEVFSFGELGAINILGMYVIPFIFSICLFGYVYKKNSADFMCSMPISRKCVFITNTIGGIILILILQLISFLSALLVSYLTSGNIFLGVAWDVFVYQTIAYIFVFIASNLAMSLSGNVVTQIAVTMLIVFVVPFSTWYVNVISENSINNTSYMLTNNDIEIMSVDKVENYTAPFLIANEGDYEYNVPSMIKMIVLSILYFIIAFILFNKKKMEIAGESFESKYSHFVVKSLTLLPFVAILNAVKNSSYSVMLIIIAIIFVYYFIFDLITGKKVKIWENFVAVIISIVMIYGAYNITIEVNRKIDKKLNLNSVKYVSVDVDNYFHTDINEKDKINDFTSNLARLIKNSSSYKEMRYSLNVKFVRKDGTKFVRRIYVGENMLKELLDDNYKNIFTAQRIIISNKQIAFTKEEKSLIYDALIESLKSLTLKDYLNVKKKIEYSNLVFSEYRNHELITYYYPITLNKTIQKTIVGAYNRYAVEWIKSGYTGGYYTIDSYDKFDDKEMQKIWFASDRGGNQKFAMFILNNKNAIPDNVENTIKISTDKFSFFTDKLDDFMKIVDSICEQNEEEFKNYYDEEIY